MDLSPQAVVPDIAGVLDAGHAPAPAPAAPGDRVLRSLRGVATLDDDVREAMRAVPRDAFVESAFGTRAWQDHALPIGHGQTISRPSVVAHMLSIAVGAIPHAERRYARALEIGTGRGYQAAVLSHLFGDVVSVERIAALHDEARSRLAALGIRNTRLVHADGHDGLPDSAPFHAIVVAAAFEGAIPDALLHLMRIGARLIAPVATASGQSLHLVERGSRFDWHLVELDAVRFVPMKGGLA